MLAYPSHISIPLLLLFLFHISMSSNHKVLGCNEKDQEALFTFKQAVTDPSNRLSSWSNQHDCCAWSGVQCHITTGRVTTLVVSSLGLTNVEHEINLTLLLQLEFLNHLDLSMNNFKTVSIRPTHHNMTTNTSLQYLDFSYNFNLHMDNLHWLPHLSSLKYLKLSRVNLQKQTNWLQIIAMLPSLSELRLSYCGLTNIKPSLEYVNFTSLVTLDLHGNNFNSELPQWLFNLSLIYLPNLQLLDLSWNSLYGEIPSSLFSLPNLQLLDLSWNQLKGSIPNSLGQPKHLQHIDLSHNNFSGSIPSSLGNLSSLIDLDISFNLLTGNLPDSLGKLVKLNALQVGNNPLSGILSETKLSKLSNLKVLTLSYTRLRFDRDTNWIPSFQLDEVYLSNTIQGPDFPALLYTQRSLSILDISNAGISSIDGDMFPSFLAGIHGFIYLSNNSISGDISNVMFYATEIYLGHNNFTGRLPRISAGVMILDVSHNSFSGRFPNSWLNGNYLISLNVASNKLEGELPLDISNMPILEFINLGGNELSGNMPIKMPPSLKMMILRSNQFVGNISHHLCDLSFLYILDLSHNKLSGSIPQCLNNITNMVLGKSNVEIDDFGSTFNLIMKGLELEYRYLGYSRIIDLSMNNLSGQVPPELFRLVLLQSLNLSHNHLFGTIPKMIGDMKGLESLDLSCNHFVGEIPQSISRMTFLEILNVSFNNFSGQIPLGSQLQTFDAWSYVGNPELCGVPLTKNCTKEENVSKATQHGGVGDPFKESLYLGMGVGFAAGFWGVCGSLFLIRTWRHACFRSLNWVADRFYVFVALKFRKFGLRGGSLS